MGLSSCFFVVYFDLRILYKLDPCRRAGKPLLGSGFLDCVEDVV